ncbi:MAG: hypothetical protein BJ554DRAFT_299, partial [Olpidium bornovanus]
ARTAWRRGGRRFGCNGTRSVPCQRDLRAAESRDDVFFSFPAWAMKYGNR